MSKCIHEEYSTVTPLPTSVLYKGTNRRAMCIRNGSIFPPKICMKAICLNGRITKISPIGDAVLEIRKKMKGK